MAYVFNVIKIRLLRAHPLVPLVDYSRTQLKAKSERLLHKILWKLFLTGLSLMLSRRRRHVTAHGDEVRAPPPPPFWAL